MCMRRRVAPAARAPVVPVGPTARGAASYSAVQLRRGPRTAHGPGWVSGWRRLAEHAAQCLSCGVGDGVVHKVGPSGTTHGSSELVKTHTPRRGRPSCRNRLDNPGSATRLHLLGPAAIGSGPGRRTRSGVSSSWMDRVELGRRRLQPSQAGTGRDQDEAF
jgi:hypothetical protein